MAGLMQLFGSPPPAQKADREDLPLPVEGGGMLPPVPDRMPDPTTSIQLHAPWFQPGLKSHVLTEPDTMRWGPDYLPDAPMAPLDEDRTDGFRNRDFKITDKMKEQLGDYGDYGSSNVEKFGTTTIEK